MHLGFLFSSEPHRARGRKNTNPPNNISRTAAAATSSILFSFIFPVCFFACALLSAAIFMLTAFFFILRGVPVEEIFSFGHVAISLTKWSARTLICQVKKSSTGACVRRAVSKKCFTCVRFKKCRLHLMHPSNNASVEV